MTGYSSTSQNKRNPTCANLYLTSVLEHWMGNTERMCHISYNHINGKELLNITYVTEESASV